MWSLCWDKVFFFLYIEPKHKVNVYVSSKVKFSIFDSMPYIWIRMSNDCILVKLYAFFTFFIFSLCFLYLSSLIFLCWTFSLHRSLSCVFMRSCGGYFTIFSHSYFFYGCHSIALNSIRVHSLCAFTSQCDCYSFVNSAITR